MGVNDSPYIKVSRHTQEKESSICGFRRRLLKKDDGAPASITYLVTDNAQAHWHRHTHEYYYVLEGAGVLEIAGEKVPVAAGDCVWIRPGHMHRAEGSFEALIIGVPPFDYDDVLMTPPELNA